MLSHSSHRQKKTVFPAISDFMDCKRREFQRQRFTFMCNSVFFKTLDRETRKNETHKKNFGKEWCRAKQKKRCYNLGIVKFCENMTKSLNN